MSDAAQTDKPQAEKKEKDVSFGEQLILRVDEIAPLLPSHIKKERFIAAAHSAVKQNPELLECTVRSLFNALAKAAQDGLLPDGREGVITSYRTKIEHDGKEIYVKIATWNPMAYGLRKRARELDNIIIDAQVVHDNDHFVWHQGDDPRIEHEPAKLGTDRGAMIGSYAIFRRENGTILHREIMDKSQVMATKNQSKAKTSLMWTTFETEGWRKAVVRRGMKTVPVSEDLERIITRDDENFDFKATAPAVEPPPAPTLVPPSAPAVTHKPTPPTVPVTSTEPATLTASEEVALDRVAMREGTGESSDELADWISGRIVEANAALTLIILNGIDDEACGELDTANRDDLRKRWNAVYGARKAAIEKAK